MKKILNFAICAIALVSCNKPDPIKVVADYQAVTYLSLVGQSDLIVDEIPSASEFFAEQVRNLDQMVFFSASFSAEDKSSSESAYHKADEEASKLINENRAKAEEILAGITDTFSKKDIGSGNFTYSFIYTFGRNGKDLDSFNSEIVYNGGDRLPSAPVRFALDGKQTSSAYNVKFTGIDAEVANTITCSNDIKVCLPDDSFAEEASYGKVAEIKGVTKNEEGYFTIQLSLSVDEANMANFKANAGQWHLLVPATAYSDEDSYDFIIYVPVMIVDSGI